ncbi:stage III sporulation protein AE [Clostridium botulinum]|uniref:Stage III sporulation protein AE n=1 Tax=Clostridium botulinum TaxID=1491 RepID=A0A6B4JJ53_CLOBO|nr:stage III sporulation protein AE [Clostridium botulinum]EES48322.1 stage III sporulation protein AE [Clostridium botulinum E1 str. 'BoNT E Beluga']MBY6760464.1 stage III sporulation protein AE [Clostridium botulinum]MBY6919371.1 stage III sporulation protein AE [Clostridium botulinum]MCR1130249.1 stage III sporulation protein AE [Clostridium botulinum]NFH69089.1 stage III sporulation protein AE [Clostridium botulinum]
MKIIKRCTIFFLISIIVSSVFNCIFIPEKTVYAVEQNNLSTSSNSDAKKSESIMDEIKIESLDDSTQKQINNLYEYINKMKNNVELMNDLDPVQYIKEYIKNGEGDFNIKSLSKALTSILFKEVGSVLKLIISIVTIVIICSLIKNLQDAFSNDSVSEIAFYACYALIIMILSKSFIISIGVAKDVISNIADFMAALLPVLITMIAMVGGLTQAATLDPIILAAVVFIPRIYSNIIIPLILMGFVLEFANNLSNDHKITNLCKLLKQSTLWMQGIIITIFIGVLTVRGITSKTIDAVTLKTTKFAVDNFIPIVGKTFSDAIASIAGYSLIIKNAISSVGLLIIILILLYPIIKLVLMTVIYKLAAALIEPISDSRITNSVAAAGESMTLIISCVLSVSLMFFILIALVASSGLFIVGG